MTDWNDDSNDSNPASSSREAGAPVGQGFFLNDMQADMPRFDNPLCAQVDGELFYPEMGGTVRYAKSICGDCTAQPECLEWALEHGEKFGVWGGKSAPERRKLIAARGIKPTPIPKERNPVIYTEEGLTARRAQLARAGRHPKKPAA
jgi:hypothetical protein